MDQNSDASLWYFFQKGDQTAFTVLFRKYYPLLHAYGIKITNNTVLTEDSLQGFFIYLNERKEKLGTIVNLKSYLFVSFKRRLLKELKKEQLLISFEENKHLHGHFNFSPQEIADQQENKALSTKTLHKLLNELSLRQKEVIYLKYYSGLNTTEISEVMGINYQSVLNTLQKAVIKLRKTSSNQELKNIFKIA